MSRRPFDYTTGRSMAVESDNDEESDERFARITNDFLNVCSFIPPHLTLSEVHDVAFLIGMVEDNAADANHNDEERERFRKASVSLSRYLHDAVQALRRIADLNTATIEPRGVLGTAVRIAEEALADAPNASAPPYHCTQCGFVLGATPTVAKEWKP